MSRICFVCGTKTMFGHSISHSNIKTNRSFKVNLTEKAVQSDILGLSINIKVSNRGMRTLYKHGSLDNFLLTTKLHNLTEEAVQYRNKIKRLLKKREPATAKTN